MLSQSVERRSEMSLRCPIPKEIREQLAADPFMSHCCIADETCEGRIEWHHNLIYAGKRVSDWWSLLPVCESHHRRESSFKAKLNKIMVDRAPESELKNYSKAVDYIALKHGHDIINT